jgi:cell wall-associated NlpC family hydrolase
MYIGKGKMVHATNPRTDVRIDSIHNSYWRGRFAGAGRIIKH